MPSRKGEAMKPETVSALAASGGYLPAIEDDYSAPLSVRPAGAARMLGLGLSKLYELIREGELTAYTVGRARFITVASVREYVARQIKAAGSDRQET
jgi:excisionase family DNA binding protein